MIAMKKIMIVDDNPSLILTVKTGFQEIAAGYDIIEAKSGNECFDLLRQGKIPDLILLDIMMPVMDGWEVQRKLREHPQWQHIPVVFLTAKTDSISKQIGSIVSKDYIEKPFDIIDLKKRVDAVLTAAKKNQTM